MSRRKRYIRGKVYITSDRYIFGGKGKKHRVVSMGNDKNNMEVRHIFRFYDDDGKLR